MPKRTVRIGLATYVRADSPEDSPLHGFAMLGEEVDVHADDVERFDRLNGPAPTAQPPLPAERNVDGDAPAGNASLEAWQEYARSLGASDDDLEGKSRNDLRDEYGN